jgi:hypothetical protein
MLPGEREAEIELLARRSIDRLTQADLEAALAAADIQFVQWLFDDIGIVDLEPQTEGGIVTINRHRDPTGDFIKSAGSKGRVRVTATSNTLSPGCRPGRSSAFRRSINGSWSKI